MALALTRRRLLGIRLETTPGTANVPNLTSSIDNTPLLRDAKMSTEPISVERPTLRLTQTPIGDIYPGVSLGTLTASFELCSHSTYSGDAVNGSRPNLTRWLQACGFIAFSESANLFPYKITTLGTDNGPLRHLEGITTGATTGWRVYGDTYADDGVVYASETTGSAGATFTGATSGTVFNVTTRGTKVFGWSNTSDINGQLGAGLATASVSLYDDGKLWALKGAAGNIEFDFPHGGAVLANVTLRGVVAGYIDSALPVPLDQHKYPPTFLGARVTLRFPNNTPTSVQKYGVGGGVGGTTTGALNSIKIRSGNDVVLHENSMDPFGVNYAIITGRKPTGTFNPDEVLESEFSFFNSFLIGRPLRARVQVVGPPTPGSVAFDNPATFNQNAYDFIVPGVVLDQLGDGDRDGINVWDGSFKLTGGDYDQTAAGEAPGNDNELTIINR